MNSIFAATIGIILFLGYAADAATVQLPKTGQNICYDISGSEISCSGTGQDGDWKSGVSVAQRFTVGAGAQAECVTDNLTGLMWVKSPDSTTITWQEAIDYAKGLSLCGFDDWRIPSIVEIESMINAGQSNSVAWLHTQGFSNLQSPYYMSSTTNANSTNWAWYIFIQYGNVAEGGGKTGSSIYTYYWPVRGNPIGASADIWETGQKTCYDTTGAVITPCTGTEQDGDLQPGVAWPSPRYTINGTEGTVTDNLTGLIWLKDAGCFETQNWENALTAANTLASGACGLSDGSVAGDWRLPNRKELLSLVDFEHSNPALSNTAGNGKWTAGSPFDNVRYSLVYPQDYYWSSTSDGSDAGYAWLFSMASGSLVGYHKGGSYSVWPVRGGQVDRLTLLTLRGGEEVLSGGLAEIKWAYQGSGIQLLDIELWKGGVFSATLAEDIQVEDGIRLWDIAPLAISGADYQIRLVNAAAPSVFTSGTQFTISSCADSNVLIDPSPYSTLQEAYDNAVTDDVIQARAVGFPGLMCDAVHNPNATYVTINGGFNCGFSSRIGFSYIDGPVIISASTVEINGIVIK